jgi:hypothetical protein
MIEASFFRRSQRSTNGMQLCTMRIFEFGYEAQLTLEGSGSGAPCLLLPVPLITLIWVGIQENTHESLTECGIAFQWPARTTCLRQPC